MLRVVRDNAKVTVPVVDIGTGQQVEAQQIVMLPPKIEREPKTDPVTGKTTGEFTIKKTDREPGESEDVTVRWPPYWLPTPTDQNAMATALTAATGGKAYLSSQTAVDVAASAFGVDPAEEWRRVSEQKQSDDAQEMAMTPGIGGQVPHKDALPPGAQPRNAPPFGGPPKGPPGAAGAPDGASDDESESEDAKPKKV
jgi:hypothetical protein